MDNDNRCILCGNLVPEGMTVCRICETRECAYWEEQRRIKVEAEKRRKAVHKAIAWAVSILAVAALLAVTRAVFAADTPRTMAPDATYEPIAAIAEPKPEPEETEANAEPQIYRVTAYCGCAICCGADADGITASGTVATAGRTIAVDPNVIPLGSTVVIGGHEYIAEDIGDAIRGNEIDVYFDTHEDAVAFGIKYEEVAVNG